MAETCRVAINKVCGQCWHNNLVAAVCPDLAEAPTDGELRQCIHPYTRFAGAMALLDGRSLTREEIAQAFNPPAAGKYERPIKPATLGSLGDGSKASLTLLPPDFDEEIKGKNIVTVEIGAEELMEHGG